MNFMSVLCQKGVKSCHFFFKNVKKVVKNATFFEKNAKKCHFFDQKWPKNEHFLKKFDENLEVKLENGRNFA